MNRLALLVAVVLCVGALAAPAAAQQTDDGTPTATETTEEAGTPTDISEENGTTTDTNEGTSEPRVVQSPSGSPVGTAPPETTSGGDGPGFGVVMAVVAGLVGAGVAARRRQA